MTSESHAMNTAFTFSTSTDETLEGNAVGEDEVWQVNSSLTAGNRISGPVFAPSFVDSNEDIDALAIFSGSFYFSVSSSATINDGAGTLAVESDDIIQFNPQAAAGSQFSIFFDPDNLWDALENTDAFSFHSTGDLLLSTSTQAVSTIASLTAEDTDIVRVDPGNLAGASIFLDGGSTFVAGDAEDIDGFSYVSDTEMYLSTSASARLPGMGADFSSGDLVLWDGTNGSIAVPEAAFGATDSMNLDAISIPEPSRALFLLLGATSILLRRRR